MNTKLKCLILDDELPGLTYLKMLCEQIPELELVKAFNNPETFVKEIQNFDFDFCILDIEMPQLNGLQVAKLLNGKPVIFTTGYKEYAAEAFDLDAVDYVRKPLQKERLEQAVKKLMLRAKKINAKSFVQLNTDKGKILLYFENLFYIRASEIDSRDKIIHLQNGEEYTAKNITFKKLISVLPKNDFCHINKKEIIALKIVQAFSFNEITSNIKDRTGQNLKFSLSEIYRERFLKKTNL